MVRVKIFAAALATCLVESANASACKPRSSLSTESQILSTVSSAASSISIKTSAIVGTSTAVETSTFAVTTASQSLEPLSTTSEASTTTAAAAPVNNICGQHGTCSPASSGCRSRIAGDDILYLGECQDLCRADPNCKSILYNNKLGQCFLNTNIAQDSEFYTISSTMFEWWDNACEIEKREPDPICGAHGECNQSRCFPMAVSGFYTAETCQRSCASDPNCESFMYFPSSEGCYTLETSLFKSGFYEQASDGLWFDLSCQVNDPAKV